MTLFCTRSPPFMSSDVIFLQAKWSKIKERVEGWKSGKKMWFKRITVCCTIKQDILVCEDRTEFCGDLNETLMNFECLLRDNKSLVFADIARVIYKSFLQHFHANLYTRSIQTEEFWLENCVFCSSVQNSFKSTLAKKLVSLF